MEEIPAVCLNCGYVFPSGIAGETVGNLAVVGARVSVATTNSCLRCKGSGNLTHRNLPIRDAIEAILAHTHSSGDLDPLIRVIDEAIKDRQSREEVSNAIESKAIRFARIAPLLPYDRTELYVFLGALTAILQLIWSICAFLETPSSTGKTGAGTWRTHIPGSGTHGRYVGRWPSR